jgi:hypothetical protein
MALEDLTTGQDLLYYTLRSGGQGANTSDDYAQDVKAALRSEYSQVLMMEPWHWAMASTPGVLQTVASLTVIVSSISGATVTLSAALTTSVAGRKFYLTSTQAMYRISAHVAGTATLTLDAPYVETPTAGPATIYQDEYSAVTGCLRIWPPMQLRGQFDGDVDLINEREFAVKHRRTRAVGGYTEVATVIRNDLNGNMQLQLAPWSLVAMTMEYEYTKHQTLDFGGGSGDVPVLPIPDRWVIAERALYRLWRNKADPRAAAAWDRASDKLNDMRSMYLATASRNRMWTRPRNSLGVS